MGEYLVCVEWSIFRPPVFACVSNTGNLYLYDLVRSKKAPIETIKLDDELKTPHSLRPATRIVFNPRERDFIAVGYYDKIVRVYRLSGTLSNKTEDDDRVLNSFKE